MIQKHKPKAQTKLKPDNPEQYRRFVRDGP